MKRLHRRTLLPALALAASFAADPALAQTVGGDLGGFIRG